VIAFLSLLLLAQPGILSQTAARGNLSTIRSVLDEGMDPNARDSSGATLLHYAVLHNRADLVELLLEHKADVNAPVTAPGVETGATPLIYAAVRENLPVTKLLIDRGAHVDASYRSGTTALHIAAGYGATELVRLLLQNAANPRGRARSGSSPLDVAARSGFRDIVALLLEAGSEINAPQPKTGATPLNEAVLAGQETVVELLIANQADPTIRDNAGFSPIENAVRLDHVSLVRTFLDRETKEQLRESFPYLLEQATAKGHADMVAMFLDQGADVNAHFRSGSTPLDTAALKGRGEIVRLLIARGADVNTLNGFGATPLQGAALGGHLTIVDLLLAHGADMNAQETQSGATALYMAASFGREEVVAALLAKGADPNICTKAGVSPLHTAIANGSVAVANQIRMRGGLDINRTL
jgi:uncharacterized protein